MSRSLHIPKYRRHSSGQARVTLHGKDHLLGPYGSAESKEAYRRLVAEFLERRGQPPPQEQTSPLLVSELIVAYWKHAEDYYGYGRNPDRDRRDGQCLRDALRVVKELYGHTAAKDFGPLALKACRTAMVAKGWSRNYVNAQVARVRRMFRWGAEEEKVPGAVFQNLRAVAGLRKGKSAARETAKVRPVSQNHVDATLAHMCPVVQAMVNFQLLTSSRPAEVCRLRPLDLDMGNPAVWIYRAGSDQGEHGEHKTAHHGHDRLILIGPRAQEVLRPYLGTKLDAYCFCPAEAEAKRHAAQRAARRTPLTPSQTARRPKARRLRAPGNRYDVTSYRNAVYRACDRAFPPEGDLARRADETVKDWMARLTAEQKAELKAWRKAHRWHPNRLRHTGATELRRVAGLDVAKTVLGHSKVETTQVYAEKDLAAAMELVAKIG
jgi:integrase